LRGDVIVVVDIEEWDGDHDQQDDDYYLLYCIFGQDFADLALAVLQLLRLDIIERGRGRGLED
jgi:hypothetical protein